MERRAGQATGLSAKASPGDAGRAFPRPGRIPTEASPCCRQPRALPWWHRFISLCLSRSLPHLHSRADSIWCKNQRDDARHGGRRREGRRCGEPLADELLQFLPFEVQYFHLLPSTAVLRQLGLSSSSPAAARASLRISTLTPLPSLLSPPRPPAHERGISGTDPRTSNAVAVVWFLFTPENSWLASLKALVHVGCCIKKHRMNLAAVVLCWGRAGKLALRSLVQSQGFSLQASNFGGGIRFLA